MDIRLRALCLAVMLATLPSVLRAGDHFHVTSDQLQRQIAAEGPRAVLARLTEHHDLGLDYVCHRIESGDSVWLQIARSLRPSSDAAVALALDYAVARALPAKPVEVLKLIGHDGFNVDYICTSPFIEPDPGIAEDYQRRALAALHGSVPHNLESVRAECIARIAEPLVPEQP